MFNVKQQLTEIKNAAQNVLNDITSKQQLESFRIEFLGKKGKLTQVLRGMGSLTPEQRPVIGQLANDIREFIETQVNVISSKLEAEQTQQQMLKEKIDITMPGKKQRLGKKHPLTTVLDELTAIFTGMGFTIAEGPEVELDYYNFEALNLPPGHPARDTQDTFYIDEKVLLRTQTSPVQIRVMEKQKPPIKIIAPGRVYRSDAVDATHSPLFHQIEGLVVDKGITMGNLKGTLEIFCKKLYGDNTQTRFRPHHFPFTEPSCEVDILCPSCNGKGCRVCKNEGWIEILGPGIIHQRVLQRCGIDPEVYSGFAFGIRLERVTMRRYGIDDLRLFFENDLRFLKQF